MVDLTYFFYTSVNMKLLNEKPMTLLKIYFDEFVTFAMKLGVKCDDVALDYDVFLAEYDDYRYYGCMMGLITCPMMFAEQKDIPDMDKMDEESMKNGEGFGEVFGDMMKGDGLTNKILDMVKIHWPKAKMSLDKWDKI